MMVTDNVSLEKRVVENVPVGDAFIFDNKAYMRMQSDANKSVMSVDLQTGAVNPFVTGVAVIHCPHASIKLYDPPAAA